MDTSLYLLTYKIPTKDILACVSGSALSILALAQILEDAKIYYKISDRADILSQEHFGFGNMRYWLTKDDVWRKDKY